MLKEPNLNLINNEKKNEGDPLPHIHNNSFPETLKWKITQGLDGSQKLHTEIQKIPSGVYNVKTKLRHQRMIVLKQAVIQASKAWVNFLRWT